MPSYKNSNKISNYESRQKDFLKKLRDKGFKNAKVINEVGHRYSKQHEDKELLIVK